MNVTIRPASEATFADLVTWRYAPPYDFYDGDVDPILNPERFFEALDDDGELVGFYYFERKGDALEIGLGLRPDLTGRGLGLGFFHAGLEFARERFGAERIILAVAAFNERAIKVYERAGFVETGRHVRHFDRWGDVAFVDMEDLRRVQPPELPSRSGPVEGVWGDREVLPADLRALIGNTPAVAYELKLPDLGEGLTEGEIARWLVAEGEDVAEDDPLVEIQTDKTTVEIPSPAAGKVARILVEEGRVVPVGTVLVVIGEDGAVADEQPRAEPAAELPKDPSNSLLRGTEGGRVRATPLVRRVAHELGVELEGLAGTGPQGRITEEDVRGAAGSGGQAPGPGAEGRREPLRGVRRLIAEHMTRAHREIPAVTWVEECDFASVDLGLVVPTVLKACALSLKDFPELNARLEGDEIVYLDRYDLGVAVQTDQGLVVPVVRDCDSRPVEDLAAEVSRLAESARAGTLKPEELRGSTFTVTSAGKLAGLFQTPIVNHPEVAILSIGRVGPRPVVRDGEIVVRPIGTIGVTFDHRVVDGARAAEFGLAVIARLEA